MPGFRDLLEAAECAHLKGVGLFRREERAKARSNARIATEEHCRVLLARARQDQARDQAAMDRRWTSLLANDESTVLAGLEAVFKGNQAPAVGLRVADGIATVGVLVPSYDGVPDRVPSRTAAGNLSLKKMTKSARASWHLALVAGHVVATARETLAAAPGLRGVCVVALCRYDAARPAPILVTTLDRALLEGLAWDRITAWDAILHAGREIDVRFKGVAREMASLDMSRRRDLEPLVHALS